MGADCRIHEHPILPIASGPMVPFFWAGRELHAREGETIASALFAHGIRIFGRHSKDGSPQGIFCANGQCAQCTVMADGLPVKSCMAPVMPGMRVQALTGRPVLPDACAAPPLHPIPTLEVECLILGGGPAGLAAAIELGHAGVRALVVDDKHRLGGKLVLQTHKFFGSIEACHAEPADRHRRPARASGSYHPRLVEQHRAGGLPTEGDILREGHCVRATAHPPGGDRREGEVADLRQPPPACTGRRLQTLVNRDLVRPTSRLFIVGGGNVGLIAGYHALQAGIAVVGLCEALPECGGYKVHKDKLARMGASLAHRPQRQGTGEVESITIARIDRLAGDRGHGRTFAAIPLVAVGLDPVNEFYTKAREFGLPVHSAGDAEEIAEASAAMFMGRIRGLEIARALGRDVGEVPPEWHRTAEVLKSRPGAAVTEDVPDSRGGVFPVFHCAQEIPCNPCLTVCPQHAIVIEGDEIMGLPEYNGAVHRLPRSVAICPRPDAGGLARDPENRSSPLPMSSPPDRSRRGTRSVLDTEAGSSATSRWRVRSRSSPTTPSWCAGARRSPTGSPASGCRRRGWPEPSPELVQRVDDDAIVCRCERVTAGEIWTDRAGARDMNQLKQAKRCCMGACGGKTCPSLILRLFREEGVDAAEVTPNTARPLFMEVPLGVFAGVATGAGPVRDQAISHATDADKGGL
jgi:hypothetical protein